MTTFFVSSRNPGTREFLTLGVAAVNFLTRIDVSGMTVEDIGPHIDATASATRTLFARQLERFASHVSVGDRIVTFDFRNRLVLFVGEVKSRYRFEEHPEIEAHPHVLSVEWLGTVERRQLPAGVSVPSTPNITVASLCVEQVEPTGALTPLPVSPAKLDNLYPNTTKRARDGFIWEPVSGRHRLRLTQTFGRLGNPERAFVVVMLNPGANELERFYRSTTCHQVRAWGLANGLDGAIYVNLFTTIEPASGRLRSVPPAELLAPGADEVMREVVRAANGPVIAGWGAPPPGFDARIHRERVDQVREIIGGELYCLGFTADGYPKHGRWWRHTDDLLRLP